MKKGSEKDMATTLSFVVGKGSLTHNNRAFVAENVDKDRIKLDEFYIRETLEEAYNKIFGKAVEEYNLSQKRKDRQISNYLNKIKNSKNNEKVFYENVVQIGKMTDYGVTDESGNLTANAIKAKEVLDEYVRTFQERNPNLYLFNAVLHMDEATPHLHLDYIPVAHGYKTGMKTRNSLTKALQEMGVPKAISKKENETVYWQKRERDYLTDLCKEKGIEIEVLGIERDDYTIPEYKEAMRAKDAAEAEVEMLKAKADQIISETDIKVQEADEKIEDKEKELKAITSKIEISDDELRNSEKKIEEIAEDASSVKADLDNIEKQAVNLPNFFGGEQMIKIPKKSFNKLMKISRSAMKLQKLSERYEAEVSRYKDRVTKLNERLNTAKGKLADYKKFVENKGLMAIFEEFLHPKKKSLAEELKYIREHIDEFNEPKKKAVEKKYEMEL